MICLGQVAKIRENNITPCKIVIFVSIIIFLSIHIIYYFIVENNSIKVFIMTPVPRLDLVFQAVPAMSQCRKGNFSTNSCKKAAPFEAPMYLVLLILLISAIVVFSFKFFVFSGK